MFQLERRELIMQRLLREGRVDVAELAESFDVTSETIRRDLTDLQRERLVRRVHGGAIPWRGAMSRAAPRGARGHQRRREAAHRRRPPRGGARARLGHHRLRAARPLHLADALDRERDLTVITNSIPIIRSLATDRSAARRGPRRRAGATDDGDGR